MRFVKNNPLDAFPFIALAVVLLMLIAARCSGYLPLS